MRYFIKIHAYKPKEDISAIAENLGYKNIGLDSNRGGAISRFLIKLIDMGRIVVLCRKGDTLFIQYPFKKFFTLASKLAHLRGAKVVTLIHDLGSFRRKRLSVEQENRRLRNADYIIVHNPSMMNFLQSHGCTRPLHCLEIFDYLSPAVAKERLCPPPHHHSYRVVLASGLTRRRAPYIYDLDNVITDWHLELYGRGLEEGADAQWTHITYHGCLSPDELIANVEGEFGLVWDGESLDECTGAWGEYLRINNPHKTSFYLRAGLPVIIWDKAALAPFVEREGVGILVSSLRDISSRLSAITPAEYKAMSDRAATIGKKIAEGHYTQTALAAAENWLLCRQ